MKKIVLSAIIALLCVTFVQAQSFHLGAKAGVNLGKIDGHSFKSGYDLGYQVGGFAELNFSKTLGIQPEVLFSQTNTKVSNSIGDIEAGLTSGEKINLNYLSIPVLLKINASPLLSFVVGPQYSILVNSHETTLQNGKDAFKSGDFSAVAGVQLNLKALRIYGRYDIGLTNINDISSSEKWKSQQIQLGIGYAIF